MNTYIDELLHEKAKERNKGILGERMRGRTWEMNKKENSVVLI